MFSEKLLEVLAHEGVVTIIAQGENSPHAVNTWNTFVSIEEHSFIVPVGGMQTMEKILNKNQTVLLTIGSYHVEGLHGQGAGFHLHGQACMHMSGKLCDTIKSHYPWARAALQIDIETYQQMA